MTLPRFWAFLAVALPVLAALIANLSTVDLTYHLRAGAEILAARAIPARRHLDVHRGRRRRGSTSSGAPRSSSRPSTGSAAGPGWWSCARRSSGVIFGCLFVIGRRRGLGTATRGPADARRVRGRRRWRSRCGRSCSGWPASRSSSCWSPTGGATRGRLWSIPVLVVVWANLHGSFFLGPLVLGLAWLEDVHDRVPGAHRSLLVAVVSALAACVTPFGPVVWAYAVGLSTNPEVTERITEWQPTSLRDVPGHAVLRVGARRRRAHRPPRAGRPVADARLARRLLRHRRLRHPRRRLVAARAPSRRSPGRS